MDEPITLTLESKPQFTRDEWAALRYPITVTPDPDVPEEIGVQYVLTYADFPGLFQERTPLGFDMGRAYQELERKRIAAYDELMANGGRVCAPGAVYYSILGVIDHDEHPVFYKTPTPAARDAALKDALWQSYDSVIGEGNFPLPEPGDDNLQNWIDRVTEETGHEAWIDEQICQAYL